MENEKGIGSAEKMNDERSASNAAQQTGDVLNSARGSAVHKENKKSRAFLLAIRRDTTR